MAVIVAGGLPLGAGAGEALAAGDGEPSPHAVTCIEAIKSARIKSFPIKWSSFLDSSLMESAPTMWRAQFVVAGEGAAVGVVAGDAAVDGAVVTVVGPVAASDAAALDVGVVAGDDAVEVVPATTGTDVVDWVETAGEAVPVEGEGDGSELCARSDTTAVTKVTTMTKLRKEPMDSSWNKVREMNKPHAVTAFDVERQRPSGAKWCVRLRGREV